MYERKNLIEEARNFLKRNHGRDAYIDGGGRVRVQGKIIGNGEYSFVYKTEDAHSREKEVEIELPLGSVTRVTGKTIELKFHCEEQPYPQEVDAVIGVN